MDGTSGTPVALARGALSNQIDDKRDVLTDTIDTTDTTDTMDTTETTETTETLETSVPN